jgi:hypothetical protein
MHQVLFFFRTKIYFHDEAGYEEPGNLLTNGFPFLFYKALQRLLDQLGIWSDVE